MATTLFLAVASYFLVERPGRALAFRHAAIISGVGVTTVILAGSLLSYSAGIPQRLSDQAQVMIAATQDFSPFRANCHRAYETNPPLNESCVFGDPSAQPDTVIWGDSHGVELAEAFGPWLAQRHRSLLQITYSSCPPAQRFPSPLQKGCEEFSSSVLRFLERPTIKNVYLALYYDLYVNSPEQLWNGLKTTIAELQRSRKNVTLIAPVPNPGYSVPQAAARRSMLDPSVSIEFSTSEYVEKTASVFEQIAKLRTEFPALEILDPSKILCTDKCAMVIDGHPVLFDDNHLSRHGAAIVAKEYFGHDTDW